MKPDKETEAQLAELRKGNEQLQKKLRSVELENTQIKLKLASAEKREKLIVEMGYFDGVYAVVDALKKGGLWK